MTARRRVRRRTSRPNATRVETGRGERLCSVIKGLFGYRKVRYRGLYKNSQQVQGLCALSNLFLLCRQL